MTTAQHYELIVIGASSAASVYVSPTFAQAGWRTALVEREQVGGTCLNVGCMPTKTMLASARVAYLARRATDYGVHTAAVTVDMAEVRQRKRDLVKGLRTFAEGLIAKADGLDLIRGEASFTGPKSLEIRLNDGGVRQLTAENIFIDTGAKTARPAVPGLGSIPALDSTSIMEIDILPEHLLVLGGGYIGVEFSQMFRRFGSQVTIVQSGEQLLVREDPDVAEGVTDILREDGVDVLLQAEPRKIAPAEDGRIQHPKGSQPLAHRLASAGRHGSRAQH